MAIQRVAPHDRVPHEDRVAVEEPLEIRLIHYRDAGTPVDNPISVTMRTPGHDSELAVGFLFAEGIIESRDDVLDLREGDNTVTVALGPEVDFDMRHLQRHFFTSSACGICGKASFEALQTRRRRPLQPGPEIAVDVVRALPRLLRDHQPVFAATAGVHASALFSPEGRLELVREDVGRHNALDKAVGRRILDDELDFSRSILLVSGRASFEIVQKAVMAGIPILLAVGAPSSLAVDLATEFGMTLCGFIGRDTFNVYAGPERLR